MGNIAGIRVGGDSGSAVLYSCSSEEYNSLGAERLIILSPLTNQRSPIKISGITINMDEVSRSSTLETMSSPLQHRRKWSLITRYDSPCAIILGLLGIVLFGSFLAFVFPSEENNGQQPSSWDVISNVLGYSYFLAWTLSFYPQIITNCINPEKAARGLSLDFIVWNIIGFALYAVYTTSLRYSAVVRQEYADRFGGGDLILNSTNSTDDDAVVVPQVKANDVAFAWHALILTIITLIQIIYNESKASTKGENADLDGTIDNLEQEGRRLEDSTGNDSFVLNEDDFDQQQNRQKHTQDESNDPNQIHKRWTKRISPTTKTLIPVLVLSCTIYGSFIAANIGPFNLLDFLYFLSYIKLSITTIKYIPQMVLNYRRKSTAGWAIWNILLDFTGGSLSIIQLIGDSFSQGGWTGVIGNPAKFGLGLVSICFDVVFIVQHYILYRNSTASTSPRNETGGTDRSRSDHATPLLADIHGML